MLAFIIRRIAYGFLVLLGVITVVFFIFTILPGDPARMMLGQRADQSAIEEIKKELGLDRNIFYQYALYLNDLSPISYHNTSVVSPTFYGADKYGGKVIAKLKTAQLVIKKPYLRKSYQSKRKVAAILIDSLPETAVLALTSIFIASLFGVLLGTLSALYKETLFDKFLLFIATMGMALPSFFVGILVAWIFGYLYADITGLNMTGSWYEVDDLGQGEYINWSNLILPAFTLGIRPLSVVMQLSRNAMLDVLSMDYIRTAKAKGLSMGATLLKHALKNSLNPVVTAISGMFASLMAGAVFIEIIFSWKGIGWEIVNALDKYDLPIIMGAVLIIATIFVLINILVDIFYGILDPRVRI